ncbi:MAG: OB-fold nucleic acid binding domain-containing protein [Aeropyrum sp.]|nr:OB-fold nucleic acid binding domain-containing protein [Aeropyrum sp.]MCE4615649.1 OB-fold nucleic acid binding domain-containing protein [Aeropyrum sp.]
MSGEDTRIMDLKSGMRNVSIKGRVLETGEPKVVETRRGPATLSEAVVGDETGRVKVTLWGDHAGKLKEGEVVRIDGAWTTSYRGKVQVNAGRESRIERLEDESAPKEEEIPEESPSAPERGYPRGGFNRGFQSRRGFGGRRRF